jgi:hypothetical protein
MTTMKTSNIVMTMANIIMIKMTHSKHSHDCGIKQTTT